MDDSITQRFLDLWNSHDEERVAEVYAVDGEHEDVALGAIFKGHDAIKAFVKDSGPDFQMLPLTEQASKDRYAVEWECEGRHTGSMPGFPATNKPFRFKGASIGRLDADGKIAENRDYWNIADFMSQVGPTAAPE